MTELRFHREVYRGTAIDEAMNVFARFCTFERSEEPAHWVVRLSAKSAAREREIVGEFANFALGLTIKSGGAA